MPVKGLYSLPMWIIPYMNSLEKQAAVARYFEILGEASGKISQELKEKYPDIPWKITIALRNIIIHDYVKLDYKQLWNTAKNDITLLLPQIQECLQAVINGFRNS